MYGSCISISRTLYSITERWNSAGSVSVDINHVDIVANRYINYTDFNLQIHDSEKMESFSRSIQFDFITSDWTCLHDNAKSNPTVGQNERQIWRRFQMWYWIFAHCYSLWSSTNCWNIQKSGNEAIKLHSEDCKNSCICKDTSKIHWKRVYYSIWLIYEFREMTHIPIFEF